MTVATGVQVTELEAKDGMRILRKGGLDLEPYEKRSWPVIYMWQRMMHEEDSRHFVVQWEGDPDPTLLSRHVFPKGFQIGEERINFSHHSFLYNEANRTVGFYTDFSEGTNRFFFVTLPPI